METTPQRRDRTTLNLGLAELKTIIPELDSAERAMLVGILGDALFQLVGTYANFYVSSQGQLYRASFLATPIELELEFTLDNAAEKVYNDGDAQTGVTNGE